MGNRSTICTEIYMARGARKWRKIEVKIVWQQKCTTILPPVSLLPTHALVYAVGSAITFVGRKLKKTHQLAKKPAGKGNPFTIAGRRCARSKRGINAPLLKGKNNSEKEKQDTLSKYSFNFRSSPFLFFLPFPNPSFPSYLEGDFRVLPVGQWRLF